MKRLLLAAALALAASADAQTLIKDLQLTGTGSQLKASSAFTLKSTATLTAESGAIVSLANATVTLPNWVPVLDNVNSRSNGDLFVWNGTSLKFGTKQFLAGDGISIVQSGTTITVTASAGTGVVGNQTANYVFAGPATGSPAPSAFRALVAADLPASGVSAGTYGIFTLDAKGRVTAASGTPGTVTSVSLTLPSIFALTGSPVTTTGTLAATLATQTANTIFAGPSTGSAAAPAFRSMVTADFPASGVTPGTYGSTTQVPQLTVDSTGRITSVTNTTISGAGGGSGALIFLAGATATASATLDFTSAITSTYDQYVIEFLSVVPATTGVNLWMRVSTNGGSTYDTTSIYSYDTIAYRFGSATPSIGGSGADSKMVLAYSGATIGNSANWGVNGTLFLYSPLATGTYKHAVGKFRYSDGTLRIMAEGGGTYESTTAVNAVRFLFSSGNIASGTIRIYGVAH